MSLFKGFARSGVSASGFAQARTPSAGNLNVGNFALQLPDPVTGIGDAADSTDGRRLPTLEGGTTFFYAPDDLVTQMSDDLRFYDSPGTLRWGIEPPDSDADAGYTALGYWHGFLHDPTTEKVYGFTTSSEGGAGVFVIDPTAGTFFEVYALTINTYSGLTWSRLPLWHQWDSWFSGNALRITNADIGVDGTPNHVVPYLEVRDVLGSTIDTVTSAWEGGVHVFSKGPGQDVNDAFAAEVSGRSIYMTADQKYRIYEWDDGSQLKLASFGLQTFAHINHNDIPGGLPRVTTAGRKMAVTPWLDWVVLSCNGTIDHEGSQGESRRVFNRIEFDEWIGRLANEAGI